MKEDKLYFSKIETKSNNLKYLAQDLLTALHNLAAQLDALHIELVQLKSVAIIKETDH